MKQNRWIMAFLAGGTLLAAAGCEQEQSVNEVGTPGSPIVFTAATSYVNGDGTRTEYSGVVYGDDNKIERIDWVPNTDKFTVNYQHGSGTGESADFLVTSASEDTYNSNAGVSPVSDRLIWAEGTDHRFYAMYPSHEMNGDGTLSGNAFSATLYPAQNQTHTQEVTVNASTGSGTYTYDRYLPDMKYAYMVAYADPALGISGNGVTLPFRPAVTTFEFRLRRNAGENGARVKRFILSSSSQALTGDFGFSITGGDGRGATWGTVTVPARTEANSAITVDFTENDATGVELPSETDEKYLDFTVFALPVNLTDLTIRLEYMDGGARVLPLYDSKDAGGNITAWHEFTGAKKYVFTNSHVPGDDEYTYHIDNLSCEEMDGIGIIYVEATASGEGEDIVVDPASAPVQFDTYKKNRSGGKVYVPIGKVEYSADGSTGWSETRPSDTFADPFAPSKISAEGIRDKADASMTGFVPQEKETVTVDAATRHTETLRGRSVAGSESAPRDLSLYTVEGKPRSGGKRVTANSYVVDRGGWFMFPLVYGNAIDQVKIASGEGVNEEAYHPGALSTNVLFLQTFQNYLGAGITSPYILTDTGIGINGVEAVIVWSDAGPGELDAVEQITNANVQVLDEPVGTSATGRGFIRFYMDPTKIHQGNFVIALRKKDDQTILWSWHIWVSDLSMKAVRMQSTNTLVSYLTPARPYTDFMQYNLGACEEGTTTIISYNRAPYYVRVTQVDEDGEHVSQVFKVIERGGTELHATMSSGTYYQFGRKDPFLPSNGAVETSILRLDNPVSSTMNKRYYSPSGYQIEHSNGQGKALNFQEPTASDAGESIRNPHVVYHKGIGSYDGQWMIHKNSSNFDASMYNLWDAKMTDTDVDELPVKTVYDPCPPGYVVPNKYSFLNFNGLGEYQTRELSNSNPVEVDDGFQYFNVIDLNGDGEISEKDYERGFYFKKEGSSEVIVSGRSNGVMFPACGYRLSGRYTSDTPWLESDVYEMGLEGWYWTTATRMTGCCFLFTTHVIAEGTHGNMNYGFSMMYYHLKSSLGVSIRPMVDE